MDRGDRRTEQFRKIFVGGLTPNVTDDDLQEHFGQWGELVDKVVMKDRMTGRSRGFGFVTYKEAESVDEAQANRPHILDNKQVETKRALPKDENSSDNNIKVEKLFVAGLKPEVTNEDLQEYFSQYGEVVSAEIATAKETGKPRGFGFVTFNDYDPVDKCIIYKPHHIGNSVSDVKKALSKEQIAQKKQQQQQHSMGAYGGQAGGYDYGNSYENGSGFGTMGSYAGGGDMSGGFGSYGGQSYGGGAMKLGGFGGRAPAAPYSRGGRGGGMGGGGRGGPGGRGFRGGGRGRGGAY